MSLVENEPENSQNSESSQKPSGGITPPRRSFLSHILMGLGLAGGYGTFAAMAGRYLYPARAAKASWKFVAVMNDFAKGDSLLYRTPSGQTITITRMDENNDAKDFIALSSVCPHLGCQVHWESNNNRFFCPCHNGAFNAQGEATGGPPKDANQSLPKFNLKIEKELLFIELQESTLV